MSSNVRVSVLLAFATVYVIWGSTYLAIRFGVETIPPFLMAGVRFAIGGGMFFGWGVTRSGAWPARGLWRSALLVGGFMVAGGIGGVTWAEQYVPSGLTALMIAMVPLWIVAIDWLRPGGSSPGGMVIVGLMLGFAGLGLLINPTDVGGAGEIDPVGAAALMGATLSWSTGSIYSRHATQPSSQPLAIGMQMMCGAAILLTASLLTGEVGEFDTGTLSARSVLAVAYLIGPGSLAYAAYLFLLRASTPAKAATYAYVNPVIALVLGAVLGDEHLSAWTLLCSVVIIVAVVVIVTAKARTRSTSE